MACLLSCVAILLVVWLYVTRGQPVVYAFREEGSPTGDPIWVLMNPFRDHAPEKVAESLLRSIQEGKVALALQVVRGLTPEKIQELSERENKHPINRWRLVGRHDNHVAVRLAYRASRGGFESAHSPVWITVQKIDGLWEPIRFEAWY